MNTLQFTEKAKQVHGNKYGYALVEYTLPHTKVKITCPTHGDFEQTPSNHINGKQGCPVCSGRQRSTTEQFVLKAQQRHNHTYDYSLVEYKNNKTKVKIICRDHGVFEQTPGKHLSGTTCPKCLGRYKTTPDFISQAKQVHGDKYDYSLVYYIQNNKKVTILCNTHGTFLQRPDGHLQGQGCPKCVGKDKTTQDFIQQAKRVHGDKYDYTDSFYIKTHDKVKILCGKHGVFEQTPVNHVVHKQGCPKCGNWISEPETKWLDQHDVPDTPNTRQVTIKIGNKRYKVDGYVPETNTVYEFWGDYWHGNPRKFEPSQLNVQTNKTFGELYEQTLSKRQAILDAGYKLVEIWESDYVK